jgi:hypothetical protein
VCKNYYFKMRAVHVSTSSILHLVLLGGLLPQPCMSQAFDVVEALANYGVNVSNYASGSSEGSLERRSSGYVGCKYAVSPWHVIGMRGLKTGA